MHPLSAQHQRIVNLFQCVSRWVSKLLSYTENHPVHTVLLISTLAFGVRLFFTDLYSVATFNADAYVYLLKSIEISRGDWSPILTHSFGLSIFFAPFITLLGGESLLEYMVAARLFALLIGTLFLIPVYFVARITLQRSASYAVLLLVALHPQLIYFSGVFQTDLLFAGLVLLALILTARSEFQMHSIYLASLVSAFAYYVRPNAPILIIAVLTLFLILQRKNFRRALAPVIIAIAIFFFAALPMLVARETAFGSPFTYGENDKIFVENFTHDVWAPNISTPTLREFISTHGGTGFLDKFVVNGLIKIIFSMVHGWAPYSYGPIVLPIILLPAFYGLVRSMGDKKYLSMYVFPLVFIAGLSAVYQVMGEPRLFIFAVPLIIILAWHGISLLTESVPYRQLVRGGALVIISIFSVITPVLQIHGHDNTYVLPEWSKWVAENVRGTLIALDEGDYAMMHLPDTRVGGLGLFTLEAPKTGLYIRRYGQFDSLHEALLWHREHDDATHLLVSDWAIAHRPFLSELPAAIDKDIVTCVYKGVDARGNQISVYKINWEKV